MATSNAATDLLEEAILNGIINTASAQLHVSDLKLQLHSGTLITDIEAQTDITTQELSATGGYATGGKALDTTSSNGTMTVASSGGVTTLKNGSEISWGAATDDWTAAVSFIIITGKLGNTGTNKPLFIGALDSAKTVSDGDTFKFAANALTITLA